jgi:hypothetical protein
MSVVKVWYLSGKEEYFSAESAVIQDGCLVLRISRWEGKKFIPLTSRGDLAPCAEYT